MGGGGEGEEGTIIHFDPDVDVGSSLAQESSHLGMAEESGY